MSSTSDGEKAKGEDEDNEDSDVDPKADGNTVPSQPSAEVDLPSAEVDLPTAGRIQASKEGPAQTYCKHSVFLRTSRENVGLPNFGRFLFVSDQFCS